MGKKRKSTASISNDDSEKYPAWSSLPWERIQTTSQSQSTKSNDDDELPDADYLNAKNHYDTPNANPDELYELDGPIKKKKSSVKGKKEKKKTIVPDKEAHITGANDPGIFYGLEVIDGGSYNVEKIPVYRNGEKGGENGEERNVEGYVTKLVIQGEVSRDSKDDTATPTDAKKSKKKNAKKNVLITDASEEIVTTADTKIKKKKSTKTVPETDTSKDTVKTVDTKISKKKKAKKTIPETDASKDIEKPNKSEEKASVDDTSSKPLTKKQIHKQKWRDKMKEKRKQIKANAKRKREAAKNHPSSIEETKDEPEKLSGPTPQAIEVTPQAIEATRQSWSIATSGVYLHPTICSTLTKLGFHKPTPIQGATLAASIYGQRDVVGAAPTGSGKTLSYLLPILQALYTAQDERAEAVVNKKAFYHPLTALILCPTRELAMQVTTEFTKLVTPITSAKGNGQGKKKGKIKETENTEKQERYKNIKCGSIIGGLSEHKQKRILDYTKPPVLVATPGRLWDLMSSGNHAHLNNLATIRFLVVDEADRMVSQGSFPQLESILDKIQRANPSLEYFREHLADESDDGSGDEEEEDRMMGLPGIRGEAKVQMLNDELRSMIAKQEKGGVAREVVEEEDDMSVDEEKEEEGTSGSDEDKEGLDVSESDANETEDDEIPEPMEMDDEEYALEQARMEAELAQMHEAEFGVGIESTEGAGDNIGSNSDEDDDEKEGGDDFEEDNQKAVKRQTFIFSATLTLPSSTHHNIESSMRGRKGGKKGLKSIDGAIADILEKVGAQGQTKVVDLSSRSALESNTSSITSAAEKKTKKGKDSSNIKDDVDSSINASTGPSVVLPPGLSLYEIKCTQMHKDSHLYSFLTTTKQGSSGPCLVFCNSIGAVKRVAETLRTLGMPVRMLHAQMQQKSRLSALESLSKSNSRSIVVCTDVAARGLDIPSVASVVHYDVARAVDTFVHRAGRTARGMGENAIGWSVSLVSASEERSHTIICRAVLGEGKKSLDVAPMDYRLLASASQRVNLATKIVSCNDAEARTSKSNQWFIDAAEEAGLDLDEDLLDDGLKGGDRRDQQKLVEAKNARKALKQLLAKPMRTQNHGKFLSTAGLQHLLKTEREVKPFVVTKDVAMDGKGASGGGGKRMKKKRRIS